MTGFDEREKGYERKFEHDQEMAFKLKARRHRLLGQWAAGAMGLKGADAESYAAELAVTGLNRHDDDEAVARVVRDLAARGVALDAARVREELARCDREAKKQLGAEP